ncbi:SH3 domain-containing protein [Streptomyces sp. HUAS ZL42]|uniref:SH3 domain-containing protein n=1 Tax=Streptomyces sp. HUAS ZL42 TaxID=3231715 RepID=UPI00345E295D
MRGPRRAKLAALAVGVLAVPAGLVVGTAGTASANASCGQGAWGTDGTDVRMTPGVSANMRSGSSTSCGIVGWADNQDTLIYYCWTSGQNGTWTYLYNQHDDRTGWVKDSLLPYNGSNQWCGF